MKNNTSLKILTMLKEGVINDNNINNLSKLIGEDVNLKKVKSRDELYSFEINGNTYNYSARTKFFSTYKNGNELGRYDLAYFYFFVLNNTLFTLQGDGTKELTYTEVKADKNNADYNMYEFDVNGVILKVKLPSEIHYDNKLYTNPSYNKETNSLDYFTELTEIIHEDPVFKEPKANKYFYGKGLELAKAKANKLKKLNVCEDVSEAIAEDARNNDIDCKAIECMVFTEDGQSSNGHYVILQKQGNVIIDYTQAQFFGSSSPEDISCKTAGHKGKGLYYTGEATMADKNGYVNKPSYHNNIESFIGSFTAGKIKVPEGIIYVLK